ncbi:50S ribosomal protein L6 [Candidatus Aminicenantes bacterium AC-334-K16]|jgi:large subunit ribosomal protein L6|nr:50S ribosomal protein L6 [Candidatus Aminicenantes bacterium AC-334-K16]
MSRVGKQPIPIPAGVKVNILPDKIKVEGPKGQLESPLFEGIRAEMEDNQLIFIREKETPKVRAFHGLCRTLAANAIHGVSQGFEKKLEIVGVGYRAKLDKGKLELYLGYSKPVIYEIPEDIEIILEKPTLITVRGIDKQRVGQEAYKIRSFRKPDPYKLKGIRYVGERLIKKERRAGVGGV